MKKGVVTGVATGLGGVVKKTVVEAAQEPGRVLTTALGGEEKGSRSSKSSLPQNSKREKTQELTALRQELEGMKSGKKSSSPGRKVEEEIEAVRREKEEKRSEEEEFLAQLREQRQQEEKEAKREAGEVLPRGKRPRGLAPWVQKGTREKGTRRGG